MSPDARRALAARVSAAIGRLTRRCVIRALIVLVAVVGVVFDVFADVELSVFGDALGAATSGIIASLVLAGLLEAVIGAWHARLMLAVLTALIVYGGVGPSEVLERYGY